MTWHPKAYQSLLASNYEDVAWFYEQAIDKEPEIATHYWHLGLAYLLQEKEEKAQSTWLFVFAQGTEQEIEQWTDQLVEILETEAQRLEFNENYHLSWLVRAHLREIAPQLINNLLHLIQLDIQLERFVPAKLNNWQVNELLQSSPPEAVEENLLLQLLEKILQFPTIESVAFAKVSLLQASNSEVFIEKIVSIANSMAYEHNYPIYAADLTKLAIEQQPDNLSLIKNLFWFYRISQNYEETLEVAQQFYDKCNSLPLKIFANYQFLYVYMTRANWLELQPIAQRHIALLKEMVAQQPQTIEPYISDSFLIVTQPLLYFQDNPQENRWLQNQVSKLFQENIQATQSKAVLPLQVKEERRRLKIGYIAHTLRAHSVGWLSRWLFQYHDREAFQIAIYLPNQQEDGITQEWFKKKVDLAYSFPRNVRAMVEQIQKDEIDILVDLDSVTLNLTCQVMAQKPAPIQVTWLGLDASGLPAIDYFIADPYVLPEDAQSYYQEKIWRLPHTYIAVNGFEVGVPTLRRDELDIPDDAIIYLNMQGALKRHPDTIRLQMKIIKAVPNSYFLIKGTGDEEIIKQFFTKLAEEEGVEANRLRFLPRDPDELTHRANLAIADIVLDTYPYNGATTTLEVLWMGIPLVTKVGQQFAARNSYAFMENVGVSEGIAWTDGEYVEWGIRLGTDGALRQQVAWKLRASRQTSPLWNARQFTQEIEKVYQQMWAKYSESQFTNHGIC